MNMRMLWKEIRSVVLAVLATAMLSAAIVACAHRPPARDVAAVPVPWCVWAEVRMGPRVVKWHACTVDRDACEAAVRKARTPMGDIAGVRGIDDCVGP